MPDSQYKVNILISSTDQTSKPAAKAKSSLDKLNSAAQAAAVAYGVLRVAQKSIEFAKFGASVQAVALRFERFAGGAEEAAKLLGAMGKASDYALDKMTAMSSGGRLLQMGLVSNAEEMGLLTSAAIKLGDQTKTASARMSDFSMLLANQAVRRLDNFGMSVGAVRKRVDELKEAGHGADEAFKLAVLEEATKSLAILGDVSTTTAAKFARIEAGFANLKTTASTVFATMAEEAGIFGMQLEHISAGLQLINKILAKEAVQKAGSAWQGFWRKIIPAYIAIDALGAGIAKVNQLLEENETSTQQTITRYNGYVVAVTAATIALEKQRLAAEATAVAQAELATILKDKTDAQIAETAISQLKKALEAGEISFDSYMTAVTETQLAFGLATPESMKLAQSLGTLTADLATGKLQAEDYAEGLDLVIDRFRTATAAAESFAQAVTIQGQMDWLSGVSRIPGYQHGTMSHPGGMALVGERGPELLALPQGSAVYPTNNTTTTTTNNYNVSDPTTGAILANQARTNARASYVQSAGGG